MKAAMTGGLLVFSMCFWAGGGLATARTEAHDALGPQKACTGCTEIPSTVTRIGPPADVDIPEVRVLAERSGIVTAWRHWFDGGRAQSRLIESTDDRPSDWTDLAIWRRGDAARSVIYAYGSGKDRILLTQDRNTGSMERSSDSGASWTQLKFSVDGKSASEWVRPLDSTPGHQPVPRLAAVCAHSPLVLFASFKLWIPKVGRPSEFEKWKDVPGMYVSHDGGDNWALFSGDLAPWSSLGVCGQDPNFAVGVRKDGLVESDDGGHSWTPVGAQTFFNGAVAVAGRAEALDELKAHHPRLPIEESGPKIQILEIELSSVSRASIYLRTNIGLVFSRDGGRTWCIAKEGSHVLDEVNGLVVSRHGSGEVVLISTTATARVPSRILRSVDGGCTFKVVYEMGANQGSRKHAEAEELTIPSPSVTK